MKKIDALTPIGIFIGVFMLFFGIVTNGGLEGFITFIDIPSFFIVLGGVFGGLLISFPFKNLKHMFIVIGQAFSQKDENLQDIINIFVRLAEKARKEGLLSLESEAGKVNDRFIKKGILLAVDGVEPDVINEIMYAEIDAMEDRHRIGRSMLEKAGEYAPSWGMIGTLIGLILMLRNLEDPSTLGPNMAVALITTLYGSLLANLFFLPTAAKLALKTEDEIFVKQVIIEGVIGVQSGQNPKLLEEKMSAYLSMKERTANKTVKRSGEALGNAK